MDRTITIDSLDKLKLIKGGTRLVFSSFTGNVKGCLYKPASVIVIFDGWEDKPPFEIRPNGLWKVIEKIPDYQPSELFK